MKEDFENRTFTTKDIITLKFRPQKFSEFIGQPQVTIPLINSIANGKIHHAYLFYGPRGVGKTSAARILAKMMNCLDFKNNEPCLKCENCIEISNGFSPDVIEIDGASNRGIDEIRNLQSNLVYAPTKSRYKIYIIDEVHMLTKEAFNALLKTLEEPPEHVVFIFATTEIHKVLPTIRSRCQQYQFTLFKITEISNQIVKILKEYNVKYDNEAAAIIAKYGNGSMRDALSILSQILSYDDKEIKIETVYNLLGIHSFDFIRIIFEKIASKDLSSIYSICSEIYYQGVSLDNITTQILEFIRLITLLKNGIEDINILNQAFTDFDKLTPLSEAFTTKKLVLMAKKVIEFQKSISLWSNPFYAFENLLVSFIFDDFYSTSSEILAKVQEGIHYLEKTYNIIETKPEEIVLKKTLLYGSPNSSKTENLQQQNAIIGKGEVNLPNFEKTKIEDEKINEEIKQKDLLFEKKSIQENLIEEDLNVNKNNSLTELDKNKIDYEKDKNIISEDLKRILDFSRLDNTKNSKKEITQIDSSLENKEESKIGIVKKSLLEIKNENEIKIENEKDEKNNIKTNFKELKSKELNMDKFANNLKKSIEKEIEKEDIPEPFKKLMKYMNGNYKE
ncbi:MAG: DNA polymerase III subunit gamma/tau [Exilispira sp.]|jgi:DNA polymerase-3 subunit gamma/tau|nr:DNA polymerase III subunit gamma/tau [Exilispira sp.]